VGNDIICWGIEEGERKSKRVSKKEAAVIAAEKKDNN